MSNGILSKDDVSAIPVKPRKGLCRCKADVKSITHNGGYRNGNDDPPEDDVYISDCGPLGSHTQATCSGKVIAFVKGDGDIYAMVKEWMGKEQYFPSVWFVSDHGNISPVTL